MTRTRLLAAAMVATTIGLAPATSASATPLQLNLSGTVAFAVLGHSCGGIQESAYGSGFDSATGYPDGDVYLKTTCSSGGRGSHPVTYTAWVGATWDFTAALVSYTTLASAPTVNPSLSVTDASGNTLYNQSSEAYLTLAPGYVPAPRVASVSPPSAPQGTTLTISGTGFTGATAVDFGTVAASTFTVVSDTSLTVTAPAVRKGSVAVTVVGPGGRSAGNPGDAFTFTLTPRVATLSPNQGSTDGGTSVTITGVNFNGTVSVTFGGVSSTSFKVLNSTTIRAVSPGIADPAVVDVVVTSKAGSDAISPADLFTYQG